MWHDTSLVSRLGIRFPIVQGPFGGFSTPRLVAAVSNCGGLGSYGALGLTPAQITAIVSEIRGVTSSPFAINLWVSPDDPGARDVDRQAFEAALAPLLPYYAELGIAPPTFPPPAWATFEEQIPALLDARPPVFSSGGWWMIITSRPVSSKAGVFSADHQRSSKPPSGRGTS